MKKNKQTNKKKTEFFNNGIGDTLKYISLSFYFMIGFLCKSYLHTIFHCCSEKQTLNNKHLLELIKGRSNVREHAFKKDFLKTISRWEFDYSFFTNLSRIIIACDFYPSGLTQKSGILPPLINKYPNVKTSSHMKPKLFL